MSKIGPSRWLSAFSEDGDNTDARKKWLINRKKKGRKVLYTKQGNMFRTSLSLPDIIIENEKVYGK
jgi:hypothetical protein